MVTADEYIAQYGGSFIWVEVVQVLDPPKANMDEEDDDFPAPVMYEIAEPYCKVGERFLIFTDQNDVSFIDSGDVTCNVGKKEEN